MHLLQMCSDVRIVCVACDSDESIALESTSFSRFIRNARELEFSRSKHRTRRWWRRKRFIRKKREVRWKKHVWKRIRESQCRSCSMTARPRYCLNRFAYLFSRELWLGMQASELFRSRLELECVLSLSGPRLPHFSVCWLHYAITKHMFENARTSHSCGHAIGCISCFVHNPHIISWCRQNSTAATKWNTRRKHFMNVLTKKSNSILCLESQACARSQANSCDAMWSKQQHRKKMF